MRRRTVLGGIGVTLSVGLAGCSGDGNGDGSGEPSPDGDGGDGDDETPGSPDQTATLRSTPETTSEDAGGGDGGDGGGDGATRTPTATPTRTPTATASPVAQVVDVADGGLNFVPEQFEVAVGDTVRWVWQGSGHNVRPNETPSGADWSGTPGGDSRRFDGGYEYAYTFEVAGEYTYYCDPHRDFMTGSFTVTE